MFYLDSLKPPGLLSFNAPHKPEMEQVGTLSELLQICPEGIQKRNTWVFFKKLPGDSSLNATGDREV